MDPYGPIWAHMGPWGPWAQAGPGPGPLGFDGRPHQKRVLEKSDVSQNVLTLLGQFLIHFGGHGMASLPFFLSDLKPKIKIKILDDGIPK